MHAAGGVFASAADLATWMRANLRGASPSGHPIAAAFALAQQSQVRASLSDGEFNCDGYRLGWYTCSYRGEHVLMHPGGYQGVVSTTVLLPRLNTGVSLVVTSDSDMEYVGLELMKAFIGTASDQYGEDARMQTLRANYPGKLEKLVATRAGAVTQAHADANWADWRWQPTPAELDVCTGEYFSPRLGRLQVRRQGRSLVAQLGELMLQLAPARPNLFGATQRPLEPPEPFEFAEDRQSQRWNDETFRRVKAGSR